VCIRAKWGLWGGLRTQDGRPSHSHHPGRSPRPQSRSRKPRANGVDPPLAAITLDGGVPDLAGTDGEMGHGNFGITGRTEPGLE